MKKLLLILLSCLLVISLVGCGGDNNKEDVDTSDTADAVTETPSDDEPSEEDEKKDPAADAKEITVKVNSTTENIRFFGEREPANENYFTCDHAASGFEMKVKTVGGKLGIRITTSGNIYFRVWIDGVAQKAPNNGSDYFSILGSRLLEINDIPDGEHTLRVLRVSDGTDTAQIYAATFKGEQLALDVSDKYFVEFLGDEMTSGNMLGEGRDDVTKAYSYVAADKLDVDRAICTYENAGLGTENAFDLYGAAAFERSADMIVVNVGKYDLAAKLGADGFIAKYKELIKQIKLSNGQTCKIVCLMTLDSEEYNAAIKEMIDDLGGGKYGYYYLESQVKTNETLTVSQHAKVADELSAYIAQIKDATVDILKLEVENVGAGESLGYNSEEWKPVA